ncbi:MAG: hypothetical protein ABIP17_09805 [Ilumatobacteraceae bacterium]
MPERSMTDPPLDARQNRLRWALRIAIVVPMAVAAARAVSAGWFPVGDSALLAIRAHDVGTADHPLLGSWTSASLTLGTNVNNPGPLYPDLLAPFMWTLGRWSSIGTGVAVGVASVNAGFALLTAWVGDRLGGWRVERWALLLVAALSWSMGSELLIDIWQPHALLIPFACLLLVTVGLLDDEWRLFPLWLGIASLIVQTHIGYVYVIGVLGVVVVVHGVLALRRADLTVGRFTRNRTVRWSSAVVGLAWLQPVIEQCFGEGRGNLLRLAANANGGDVTIGGRTAVELVALVVALPPWWTRFGFADSVVSTPLTPSPDGPVLMVPGLPGLLVSVGSIVLVVALLGALTVLLRRRGATTAAGATLISLIGVVTGVATLTVQTVSVVGLGSHHVRWLFVLALFVHLSILWAIVELLPDVPRPAVARIVIPTAITLLCMANVPFFAQDLGPTADRAASETLDRTFDDLTAFTPGGPVRYDVGNLRPFEPWSSAVQMRLVELGIEFHVADEGVVRQLGNRRRADGSDVTTVSEIERGAALTYDGPGCVLSIASPLDPSDERVVDAVIASAVDDLVAGAVEIDTTGLDDDLPARFAAATSGDRSQAQVLVADGLLPFLSAEGRIVRSTPAVDAAVTQAGLIDRRVVGTLLLIADPPIGCPG